MNMTETEYEEHTSISTIIPFTEKLFSNRLILRRLTNEDLTTLVRWCNSDDAYGNYLSPEQFNLGQAEQKFNAGMFWNDSERVFLVEKKDGSPIGTIHYWLPAGKVDTAIVALKIAEPDERNHGYGTEAQKSLIIYLFEKIKVRYVEMFTDLDNLAQQRCLQKLGFTLTETLIYDDQGIRRTGNRYSLSSTKYAKEPIFQFHYE